MIYGIYQQMREIIIPMIDRRVLIKQKMEAMLGEMAQAFTNKILPSQEGLQLTAEEEDKLITNILFKMSTYFIQLTEICIGQMSSEQAQSVRQRVNSSKDSIHKLFSKRQESAQTVNAVQADINSLPKIVQKIKLNKPKHPVSSFFFFFKQKSREIAFSTGEKIGSKIAKLVADIWKSMNEREKEPFELMARETRSKYDEQMRIFKIDYAQQIAELKKIKKGQKKLKKERMMAQAEERQGKVVKLQYTHKESDADSSSDILSDSLDRTEEMAQVHTQSVKKAQRTPTKLQNKPKAPVSSFFIYYRQNGKKLSEVHNLPLGPRLIKIASEKWNNLTEGQKEPYNEASQKTRRKYYQQMTKFKVENADQLRQLKRRRRELKKAKA